MNKASYVIAYVGYTIAIGILVLAMTLAIRSELETEYPLSAMVVETNREKNEVIVEDYGGNRWCFEGIEDWETGDICAMIMNDDGTETIYDDEIVSVRYCGHMEKEN